MPKVRETTISELTPDARNANRGTERGSGMLEHSLRQYGAGRSILLDKHGRIIAGNKTAESAGSIGLDDVLVVQTDGTKLVAVQRMDLDLDDPRARELAYADNRVGIVDLDFDAEMIAADLEMGIDLSAFWGPEELAALTKEQASANAAGDGEPEAASPIHCPECGHVFTL